MPDVEIISAAGTGLGIVDRFERLTVRRRFWRSSEAELVVLREEKTQYLVRGNFLAVPDPNSSDLLAFRIEQATISRDAAGIDRVTVKAVDPGAIFDARLIIPPAGQAHDEQKGVSAETAMKHYVKQHAVSGFADTDRVVPGLGTATDMLRGRTVTVQGRYQSLLAMLEEIGHGSGLGWKVDYTRTPNTFTFEVIPGIDRSTSVFLDPGYDSAHTQQWLSSNLDVRNTALVAGQGEGVNRVVIPAFATAAELSDTFARQAAGSDTFELNLWESGHQWVQTFGELKLNASHLWPSGGESWGGYGFKGRSADLVQANSEYLTVASNASLQTGDISFTFAFWVRFDVVTGYSGIAGKYAASPNREWKIELDNTSRVGFGVSSNGTAETFVTATNFGALATGTWYLVVAWHDATANEIGIAVNGTANTAAHSAGVFAGNGDLRVGLADPAFSGDTTRYFDGRINNVAFWKGRALSSSDRTLLYNAGVGRQYDELLTGGGATGLLASLTSWWPLYEANARTRYDVHGANDLSDVNTVAVVYDGPAAASQRGLSADGYMEADVNLGADGATREAGLIFRVADNADFWLGSLYRSSDGATNRLLITSRIASAWSIVGSLDLTGMSASTTYRIKVAYHGSSIAAAIEGKGGVSAISSALSTNKGIGVYFSNGHAMWMDALAWRGGPAGWDRREAFVDARDLNDMNALIERGADAVQETQAEERFEATIEQFGPFRYKTHWDLGDLVTLRNDDWGIQRVVRIVEVTLAWTGGGTIDPQIDIILDKAFPTLPDLIQRFGRAGGGAPAHGAVDFFPISAVTPGAIGAASTAHELSHHTGGSDELTPAEIGAAAASHGFHDNPSISNPGSGSNITLTTSNQDVSGTTTTLTRSGNWLVFAYARFNTVGDVGHQCVLTVSRNGTVDQSPTGRAPIHGDNTLTVAAAYRVNSGGSDDVRIRVRKTGGSGSSVCDPPNCLLLAVWTES